MDQRSYRGVNILSIMNAICNIVEYGIDCELISEEDRIYTINQYLALFGLDEMEEVNERIERPINLEETLSELLDYAAQKGMIPENTTLYRDLFDTKIMGILVPRPSAVIQKFRALYKESPQKATDFYYKFSQDTNYIRRDRIKKDLKWKAATPYGELDISINLSKPEKDPKEIAAARNAVQSGYPKCLLCKENEGYAGRVNSPARQNHRIIPIQINQSNWFFQYSPYVYYKEHCIVFNSEHTPMKVEEATFRKLLDFVQLFPHYFVGSNADLPIVGGSILSHDHFQGGNYEFPMAKAEVESPVEIHGFENVEAGIVKWPMSVIRLSSKDTESLVKAASHILKNWRVYTDESAFIYAETEGVLHNTITPIARKRGDKFELDLVLRNNITTKEHPLGVFHPHAELHHIKKENIGLIEVMGLAILPARLKQEMSDLKEILIKGSDVGEIDSLKKHEDWVTMLRKKYENFNEQNVTQILRNEIGIVFGKVLEDAGVYKCSTKGREDFMRFIHSL